MPITREQLEPAALAAGMPDHDWIYADDGMICIDSDGDQEGGPWRPHLDDGDAARLAVRLSMSIDIDDDGGLWCHALHSTVKPISVGHDGTEPDKLRAWREAVVLCAAAVGERMRSER